MLLFNPFFPGAFAVVGRPGIAEFLAFPGAMVRCTTIAALTTEEMHNQEFG
jgi:hypothetical protein